MGPIWVTKNTIQVYGAAPAYIQVNPTLWIYSSLSSSGNWVASQFWAAAVAHLEYPIAAHLVAV